MRALAKFASDCTTGHHRPMSGMGLDQKDEITNLCSQMMHELQDVYDPDKVSSFRLNSIFFFFWVRFPYAYLLLTPVSF